MPTKRAAKEEKFGFDGYLSPFTWRYGSREMRATFSEKGRRAAWRKTWLALAEAQHRMGLVSEEELEDIRSMAGAAHVDMARAHELEKEIKHDLMAELRTFAEQAKVGGGKLHLGATSMDIEDNADIILYSRALDLVEAKVRACLDALRARILEHSGTVCMAWTHLQPAEPTTLGYRLANYAQDLILDLRLLEQVRGIFLIGKGVKGAVGTSASYKALLGSDSKARRLEEAVMEELGLRAFEVSTQTYPRKVDLVVASLLASIAQSCHKFGLDLRVMQSPAFGELSEPFGSKQVGSSAMPFKKNPVSAERMCSLARLAASIPPVAWGNAANSILERTLDDSAGRRVAMSEAFLAVDECLGTYEKLVRGLVVYPEMMKKNLESFGPFSGTEAVMMKLVEKGGDRQRVHEELRVKSVAAWAEVMKGRPNPLVKLLSSDRRVASKIGPRELKSLLDPKNHTGDAEKRAEEFVEGTLNPLLAGFKAPKREEGKTF